MLTFLQKLSRKKQLSLSESNNDRTLSRCLTTFDLTLLGVGATLGVGIYVLAGQVAKDTAGPAVLISFLVAGIASFLSALCYAELGARVPLCGSAYVYTYVAVGEFVAFVIGWNLLLEYVIGTASVARAYSGYLDSLLNDTMKKHFQEAMPIHVSFLSPYPDFCAMGITLCLTAVLSIGVKESTRFNNLFTILNIIIVIFVTIFGFIHADFENWSIPQADVPKRNESGTFGTGGFFPYGLNGVLAGAATCFYGFVGFDAIATSGEEALNPQRSIPISLVLSLSVIFISYCGISSVLTLMVPYFAQDVDAPLPGAFEYVGWPVGRWIVAVGALFGLSTSLLGAMFPLPRVILAMASDGVIFRYLANVHPKLQTPLVATIISGIITGLLAMLLDLQSLVDMMSIGTLMAYMIVSVCVIILHYKPPDDNFETNEVSIEDEDVGDTNTLMDIREDLDGVLTKLFNLRRKQMPNSRTYALSVKLIWCFLMIVTVTAFIVAKYLDNVEQLDLKVLIPLAILIFCLFTVLLALNAQPRNSEKLSFKVPFVPFVPSLAVFVNIYLMMKLSVDTWIRFFVWLFVGLLIYFFYGIRNSTENDIEVEGESRGVSEIGKNYGSTEESRKT